MKRVFSTLRYNWKQLISASEIDTELPAQLSFNHTVLVYGEFKGQRFGKQKKNY